MLPQIHVRHGDKAVEAAPTPDEAYWEAAQRAVAADRGLRRRIFLSTEDPATVEYFKARCLPLSLRATVEYFKARCLPLSLEPLSSTSRRAACLSL
jgi:hypothetical protein